MSGKAGWVVKEGGKYKSWKRRWLVIEGDYLCYYKKENKKEKCGEIDIRVSSRIQKVDYKKHKNCFQIVTPNRTYHITCETHEELVSWCDAIRKQQQLISAKANERKPSSETVESVKSPVPSNDSQTSINSNQQTVSVTPSSSTKRLSADYNVFGEMEKDQKVGFEDFDLLKVIGRSTFGKLMLVRKKDDGKFYAMKVLNKRTIVERNEVECTVEEKNILMRLNNPFLLNLHFLFQTSEKLYFITDYVNGGELFYYLQKEKKFPEEHVRFYVAEIVLGLEYLHQNGVIFKDLKPENILLTHDGHIVLTEFGISKSAHSNDDGVVEFSGPPEYLAPEILEGNNYNKNVDWWSLGAIMYEMLVGTPIFYSEEYDQIVSKVTVDQIVIPNTVSKDAADLILKFLERNPSKRLQVPETIKRHPFFKSIDWNLLKERKVKPPFIPNVKDECDTSLIDPILIEDNATFSDEEFLSSTSKNAKEGHTYVSPNETV